MKRKVIYIASFSGGKDSTAMLELIIEQGWPLDAVVRYDNGADFEAVNRLSEKMGAYLTQKGIKYYVVHPKSDFFYEMTEKEVRKKDGTIQYGYGPCSNRCRWHTGTKLKTIEQFYKDNYPEDKYEVREYVGIACDEQVRLKRSRSERQKHAIIYPLVELGITEEKALEIARVKGWDWQQGDYDLYDKQHGLDRVSCWCCGNTNLSEYRQLYHNFNPVFEQLKELQAKMPDRPMYCGKKTIQQLEERFRQEDAQITLFDFITENVSGMMTD